MTFVKHMSVSPVLISTLVFPSPLNLRLGSVIKEVAVVQPVVGLWRISENCLEQNGQHDPFHQQKTAGEASLKTCTPLVFVFYVVSLK